MLKRIFSIFAIALIISGLFFEGYSMKCPVFADDNTDGWMNVTTNDQLVEAFRYYCKSRDLTIEGSVADAVTSFTTKSFNGICNFLGIDITALQAQLKYRTDDNLGVQFLFTTTGIDAYNRIFSQFLQDNELEVGDSNVNETVYSGRYFVDDNNIGCLCFIYQGTQTTPSGSNILALGNTYIYDWENIASFGQTSGQYDFTYKNNTYHWYHWYTARNGGFYSVSTDGQGSGGSVIRGVVSSSDQTLYNKGICTVAFNATTEKLYMAVYYGLLNGTEQNTLILKKELLNQDTTPCNISIVSQTINNNNYEGDTIINNEGDIINNNYPDDPDLPPSNPTIPDDGGWQDFQLPSMPNDWLIYGMEKKFPFDIPFNIMFALSLLNHEPEIPQFEGDIDLKVCTWHYDIDLTPFDDIATILRRFEVLAFIIGLAILTKELIMWG